MSAENSQFENRTRLTLGESVFLAAGQERQGRRRGQVERRAVIDNLEGLRVEDRNANVDDVQFDRGRRVRVGRRREVELSRLGIRGPEDEGRRVRAHIRVSCEDESSDRASE